MLLLEQVVEKAKVVAMKAAREAGALIKSRFDGSYRLSEKDAHGDVVTEVDHLAEEIMLQAIEQAFPDHHIHSEEAGDRGPDSDWLWLIDPLDGTNNYVIGLPVFSVSVTLMYKRVPVFAVIYEPMVDRMYVTGKGMGAFCNDVRMTVGSRPELRKGTVGWIQGHAVQNDAKAVSLRRQVDVHFKRMMRLWAPTLQWCMLAKGDLNGIIVYNSEGDDLYSGLLMVQESGGIVVDFQGNPFQGMIQEPYLLACHPQHLDEFLHFVKLAVK
jgi:myo-inositol-1(or 4)-monophosphatase